MVGAGSPLRGSVRWAFNIKVWQPTEQEWLLASRCVPEEDKARIQKYAFKADAKATMAGCLMIRKLIHLASGVPYDKISIVRGEYGRPKLKDQNIQLEFNISHQGSYTVLAGEVDNNFIAGVDVMNLQRRTGHELTEFFRLMDKICSADEWTTILSPSSEDRRSSLFFRHWCLKESYMKATGTGIRTNMRHVSFKLNTPHLSIDKPVTDTILEIDKVVKPAWCFHEWLLDPQHCVAVALSTQSNITPKCEPVPFTELTWTDLIKDIQPILPPDANYCRLFMEKKENAMALQDKE